MGWTVFYTETFFSERAHMPRLTYTSTIAIPLHYAFRNKEKGKSQTGLRNEDANKTNHHRYEALPVTSGKTTCHRQHTKLID